MNYYLDVLKNYAKFDGRARRSEYWYFVLFNTLIIIGLGIIDAVLGTHDASGQTGYISSVYQLGVLVPTIAVAIRRMHDVGKSGWFILIPLYNLYLAVQDSEPGTNEYGPNPKNPEGDIADHLVG